MNRNFGLDILRAIAILGVLLFHSLPFMDSSNIYFKELAARGWAGVDLFFVLSGFLVGSQLLNNHSSLSKSKQCLNFWIKRWTRTVPLYLLILSFYVIIKPQFFNAPFAGGFNWKWILFLQNFSQIHDFGQTWSLAIEEQFYLIFPLLALLFSRKHPAVWLLPMFFSIIFRGILSTLLSHEGRVILPPQEFVWIFRFPTWAVLDSISMGVFLSKTYSIWSTWSQSFKKAIGVIGLIAVGLTLAFIPEKPQSPIEITALYFLLALGFGLILIYFESIKTKIQLIGFLEPIALSSYSIYLLHDIVARFTIRYFLEWNHWLLLTSYLLISIFISQFTYAWIEIPALKLRKFFYDEN